MKKLLKSLMFSAVFLGAALPATAATIVDTGEGFDWGLEFGAYQYFAGRFELIAPHALTSVKSLLDIWRAGTASFEIRQSDNDLLGAVIYSQSFEALTTPEGASWIGLGGLNWTLGAGTYWVSLVTDDWGLYGTWFTDVPNPLGKYAVGAIGYPLQDILLDDIFTPSFRIEGTPVNAPPSVPLPAGGLLLISGLGLLALRRKRG